MTAFGPTPIDPRSVQASLAAAHNVRSLERTKPTSDEAQRARDAAQRRVAGAESESAVRRTADEHAEEDSESHRDRRDGRRDEFQHDQPMPDQQPERAGSTPPHRLPEHRTDAPAGLPHIDVRG